jgi:hypothetical protein
MSIGEIVRKYNLNRETVASRIKRGLPFEQVVQQGTIKPEISKHRVEGLTLLEVSEQLGLSYDVVRHRYIKGCLTVHDIMENRVSIAKRIRPAENVYIMLPPRARAFCGVAI